MDKVYIASFGSIPVKDYIYMQNTDCQYVGTEEDTRYNEYMIYESSDGSYFAVYQP